MVSMARSTRKVTFSPQDLTRIPDAFIKGALLVMRLLSSGVLDRFAQLIRIRRQGGYCGFDIWLLLFFYFAMPDRKGIRAFWKKIRVHQVQLAALAGRKSLPSPSSLARALGGLEFNEVRLISHHLLMDVAHTDALLKHPATQTYDATGQGWHLFDLDPTITTLRQRALPVHDDLPTSQRRAAQSGAPGYSGRKRGDIQFCRTTVNHAGSGLWVHAHLSKGKACGAPVVL